MSRVDKSNYYLDIAEVVLERSTCFRRQFGAVIVKNDEIISTGYNGAARGCENCLDLGVCVREHLGIGKGQRYELCRAVHAEMNAIISVSRAELLDSTLYIACHYNNELYGDVEPCMLCKRLIINSGIKKVLVRETKTEYKILTVEDWVKNDKPLEDKAGY
ncbi:MAG: dCMP deaminase family protein [Oscillospiraceae bacterium]|jgi:dCMP deaminase|nr:dCMP deaminase family protein [Oscillospiraceae bacterium]